MKEEPVSGQVVHCRAQSYQGASDVCVDVFAKGADKERSKVLFTTNSVEVDIFMNNDTRCVKSYKLPVNVKKGGKKAGFLIRVYQGLIDPEKSSVKYLASKVELVLRKASADQWNLDVFK